MVSTAVVSEGVSRLEEPLQAGRYARQPARVGRDQLLERCGNQRSPRLRLIAHPHGHPPRVAFSGWPSCRHKARAAASTAFSFTSVPASLKVPPYPHFANLQVIGRCVLYKPAQLSLQAFHFLYRVRLSVPRSNRLVEQLRPGLLLIPSCSFSNARLELHRNHQACPIRTLRAEPVVSIIVGRKPRKAHRCVIHQL